jgi:hypothetical protein
MYVSPLFGGIQASGLSARRKSELRRFRALLIEQFEDRRLLDAGLVAELRNQLAGSFSPLNTALRSALTNRELPILGSALGTRLDPLGSFAAPLGQLPAAPPNIVALSHALDAIAGIDVINPPTTRHSFACASPSRRQFPILFPARSARYTWIWAVRSISQWGSTFNSPSPPCTPEPTARFRSLTLTQPTIS